MQTYRHQAKSQKPQIGNRILVTILLLVAVNLCAEEKKSSKRLGKLLITVTALERPKLVRAFGEEGTVVEPRDGYRFVLVRVKVKNIDKKRAVQEWMNWSLRTNFGLEFRPTYRVSGSYQRDLYELLPGEEAEGAYIFEVKNGTTPLQMIVILKRPLEEKRTRISIEGLWGPASQQQ